MQERSNLVLERVDERNSILISSLIRASNQYNNNNFLKSEILASKMIEISQALIKRMDFLRKSEVILDQARAKNLVDLIARDILSLETLRPLIEQVLENIKTNIRTALNTTGLALATATELERKDLVATIILKIQKPLEESLDELKALENQLKIINKYYKEMNKNNPDYYNLILKEAQIDKLRNIFIILGDILNAIFVNGKPVMKRKLLMIKNEIDKTLKLV